MNVLSVGFPGAWSLLTDDAGWTWSETCVAVDSMPVRSIARERRGRGRGMDGAWVLCFSSVCPNGALPHTGADGTWGEKEGENKPNFYPGTGNKRFSVTDPAFLTIVTPDFSCGILASWGAVCPLDKKATEQNFFLWRCLQSLLAMFTILAFSVLAS